MSSSCAKMPKVNPSARKNVASPGARRAIRNAR
jgi:hypothetical protein